MGSGRSAFVALTSLAVTACGAGEVADTDFPWFLLRSAQESGTDALLQAVSPVSDDVVWVSGHQAMYARTLDGGETWLAATVPDAEGLQFRDVAAFSAETAYLMSAGTGDLSRIYRTDDGGASWSLQYVADHPEAFLDCMDFWSAERGLVYGDAVDGVPFLLATEDGGATWARVSSDVLPSSLEGEGGFAASGTCLRVVEGGWGWVATGNAERARVLTTSDYGASWSVVDAPVVGGSASGLTTVEVRPDGFGVALGGVIGNDSVLSENVAITTDGGATWTPGGPLAMTGPVYGSALVPTTDAIVAVGPRGLVWSSDRGGTWTRGESATYWAVAFSSRTAGWAVGPVGRVVKLSFDVPMDHDEMDHATMDEHSEH